MADARFFKRSGPLLLSRLAEVTGARLANAADAARQVQDVAPLETAGAEDVSFLDNVKYADAFAASRAGACFAREKFASRAPAGMALLLTETPYAAYAQAVQLFYPLPFEPHISPAAHIGNHVEIGPGCRIEAGAWIGDGCVLGEGCCIGAHTTISHAIIGCRVIIHPGAHIGQDGFGFAAGKNGVLKVPQLGRVIIGNDVEIGAGACIDRGAGPDTVIGDFCKIDNLVQIGHNCVLGRGVMIAGQAGLSGSTRVEDFAQVGGQAGTAGHLTIGKGGRVAAQAGVMRDVAPGETVGGFPAMPIREWHRQTAALRALARREPAKSESN